jgi:trans-aconitate methyltransferase
MENSHYLRTIFNSAAQDYHAARPGYPEPLYGDIVALSGIPPDGQVLEIGCGTGQATLPFAKRGYAILCLDIGPDLLAIAAQNLRDYPNVRFENISFEEWPSKPGAYDLIFAATAFHWIPRETGYPKAAEALKPGAALAIFSHIHPRPFTGFFAEVQSVYDQYMPKLANQRKHQTTADEIEEQAGYMRTTGLFRSVEVRTYPWSKTYTTNEYLRLLDTHSDHRSIEIDRRRGLYQAIADLVESRYDGKVERPYLTELYLAKK